MKTYDATEQAYKKGYKQGYEDGKPKWIPVTERLPESHEKVLICSIIGNQYVAQRLRGHFYVDGNTVATSHWMPLPEPPKGE